MKRALPYQLVILGLLGVLALVGLLAGRGQSQTNGPTPALSEPREHTDTYLDPTQVPTAISGLTLTAPSPVQPEGTTTPQPGGSENSAASAAQIVSPADRLSLDPTEWHTWPVIPSVPAALREIYLAGLAAGNNAHAFSFLGDCQSQPDVFMGVFDDDASRVKALPKELQETVAQFAGSFNRYSPTVKDGTTEGALLWGQWNDNQEKKCTPGETPLDCELRVHKPSIVFIHVGTHYEDRNRRYLVTIVDKILKTNAIPIFVTKADNLERDERINAMLVSLAAEYRLPLWNFWASVQHLPNHGLKLEDAKYLTDEGVEIHRLGALAALDAVWRELR